MSALPNDLSGRERVSKVSFSPISSDLLVVRIRKMSSEVKEEDIPKISSSFTPIRRNRSFGRQHESASYSTSTMTDEQKKASSFSQTGYNEQTDTKLETGGVSDSTPCLKHAAENISHKASVIPSEKINLCNNCSKSMLSYIFLVQDFLDSLAKEIIGNESSRCLQCARQEIRNSIATLDSRSGDSSNHEHSQSSQKSSEYKSSQSGTESKGDVTDRPSSKRTSRAKCHRQESKRNEDYPKHSGNPSHQGFVDQQSRQVDFLYNVSSSSNVSQDFKRVNLPDSGVEKRIIQDQTNSEPRVPNHQQAVSHQQNLKQVETQTDNETLKNQNELVSQSSVKDSDQYGVTSSKGDQYGVTSPKSDQHGATSPRGDQHGATSPHGDLYGATSSHGDQYGATSPHSDQYRTVSYHSNKQPTDKPIFRAAMERMEPNFDSAAVNPEHENQNDPNNNFPVHSPTLFRDDVDGIVSTLSNAEREIYDNARNRAGWESLTETQEKFGPSPVNLIASEAFVTYCRNNAEAIGCLVVGTSLLLCRTSRTLCVLVSDGVSTTFRGALSSVFQVVQYVRSLDSLGTTKLALLEQPELGITFDKLNIWRLVQFTKCVYLNPDTLVIQNCDELFCHEELSAVPDIGWPDCFNSGVFVFSPSIQTFWKLLEFADKQGSYDGGDQGLMNSFFNSWSSDISKKLSFIYNLMANVSYTYTPAFRQFGRNVKIVQFHGSYKPWHVKFFTNSGQVSPSSPVHPTYIQFVHIWLNIFRISVLRLMSQEIQSYAASQETICAVEILRFFPLPSESEAEFFLSPPSVRVRLAEKKLTRSTSLPISEVRRRKSAEFFRYVSTEDEEPISKERSPKQAETNDSETVETKASAPEEQAKGKLDDSVSETDEVFKERKVTEKEEVKDENTLPGAKLGDYQGMKAWEQGRMDYQGTDSSDNVMKRLEFLMSRPK